MFDVTKPTSPAVALTVDIIGTPVRCDVASGAPVAAVVGRGIGLNTGRARSRPVDFALPVSRLGGTSAVADAQVITGPEGADHQLRRRRRHRSAGA